MIHYRDITFCSRGEGCTCSPDRRLTDEVWRAAEKIGLPVAYAVRCKPSVDELMTALRDLLECGNHDTTPPRHDCKPDCRRCEIEDRARMLVR